MKFAFVTFVNNNQKYIDLLSVMVKSVLLFTRHSIIVYFISVPENIRRTIPENDRVFHKQVSAVLPGIYSYKPYVILNALYSGLETGYLLEADDIVTPNINLVPIVAGSLDEFPISPIHPSDVHPKACERFGITKTQPYIHGHLCFSVKNLKFLQNWYALTQEITNENWDETALNLTYWKSGATDHYLPIVDPYFEIIEKEYKTAWTLHGCKDPEQARNVLNRVSQYVTEQKARKRRVISFCLWGQLPKYNTGAIKNAELAHVYYPDFECWFYFDLNNFHRKTVWTLMGMQNVRIIPVSLTPFSACMAMAWRFLPNDSPNVELFMSRDTDTRILTREVSAVREWLQSGKKFHILRDSPCHYPVVLGGMFGCRRLEKVNMKQEITDYFSQHPNSTDQDFLKDRIHPLIASDVLVHDEIKGYEGFDCREYPEKWNERYEFVGEYVDENEKRDSYYHDIQVNYIDKHIPHRVNRNIPLKVSIALLACDSNTDYLDFYPTVKKAWERICVRPILILVANSVPESLKNDPDVVLFLPVPEIHPAFQAQVIRLLYASLVNSVCPSMDSDAGIILSDMDMVPLSYSYFHRGISDYRTDNFVVYRTIPGVLPSVVQEYPICYCLATAKVWGSIFNIRSVPEIVEKIREWYNPDYAISSAYSQGWSVDQRELYRHLTAWNKQTGKLVILQDEKRGYRRLDRGNYEEIEKVQKTQDIRSYTDFHLPRPYSLYSPVISNILSCVPKFNIYILHYTRLYERRKVLENLLMKEGLYGHFDIHWVTQFDRERVHPKEIKKHYKFQRRLNPRVLSIGEIANHMGHLHILGEISKQKIPALVLEDDVIFKPNFLSNLTKVLLTVPYDWDVLGVGGHFDSPDRHKEIIIENETDAFDTNSLQIVPGPCIPTCCFMIQPAFAQTLLQHPIVNPFHVPIDESLLLITRNVESTIFWAKPWLAYEGTKHGIYTTSFAERLF